MVGVVEYARGRGASDRVGDAGGTGVVFAVGGVGDVCQSGGVDGTREPVERDVHATFRAK
jgi:hypothetical protein